MIKYFLVNNASRAAVYGIGTYIKQMAECILNSQSQYELCFIDIYSEVKEFTISKDEAGVIHYKIPSLQSHCKAFLYYRCILFWLNSYISQDESVIFHFNYSQHYDLIRMIKAKYKFCQVIYTIHYFNWCFALKGNLTQFRKSINNELKEPLKDNIQKEYFNDKRLFSLCDDIIVLSKFTLELLRNDYGVDESKIHLVYNGLKKENNTLQYSNENKPKQEILFVGRLDEIKGIEYIIKAFKIIVTRRGNVHLTLVGDGDFSRYLKLCEGVWDDVTFTGKVPQEKLSHFLQRATIGIQPSFHEQCSYSAIEMMAYGIPFIATDSTGLGEMMDYTPECLIHIDEHNFKTEHFVEQLADRIELLLSDSQLRTRISKDFQRLFYKRYSISCMDDAMRDVWASCGKKEYCISKDFLQYLDHEIICLINKRPILDMDSVGLTGIGCYLWWRIRTLEDQDNRVCVANSIKLQEYLIYYIDWLFDVISEDGKDTFSSFFEPIPFNWLLNGIKDSGFYKTKVEKIFHLILSLGINIGNEKIKIINSADIIQTALKIYNLNL